MRTSIYISMPNKISVCSMCHLGFSLAYFSPEIYENIENSPLRCTDSLERSSLSFRFEKVKKNALPGDPYLTLLAMLAQLLGKAPTTGGKISSGALSFSEESVWCHWWQTQCSCVCLLSEASASFLAGYCSYFFSFSRKCVCPETRGLYKC